MDEFFNLVGDVGFPMAAAIAAGYFVFLTMKFILAGVTSDVKDMDDIIVALNNRVKIMAIDVIRIDTLVSIALGLKPDLDRLSRTDGKKDARKD